MIRALKIILCLILIIGTIYIYGSKIEIKNLKINEYKIQNENLTENFDGFKIIHISDIHYGKYFTISDLKKLIKNINKYKPDIVVMTGDLIDKETKMTINKSKKLSEQLAKINAKSGKYAISGDNDLNFDEWTNIIQNSGFINLNNSFDTIYNNGYSFLEITGIDSFKNKESIINKNQKAETFLNSFEKDGPIYKILIMHEPDYIDELENNPYDLILAGHSLGGQVQIPFIGPIYTEKGAKKYKNGHYKINNADLYVSNGISTSKYNFRLFNTPSFNVYRLIKK